VEMIWSGIFSKKPSKKLNEFMSKENIAVDSKLVKYEILASKAHVKMLAAQKILKKKEADGILVAIAKIEKQGFVLKQEYEDVHMNLEKAVTQLTSYGKKMHTARSRNDQINTLMRLYMKDACAGLKKQIKEVQKAFKKHSKGVIPGYTHTRVAQPLKLKIWSEGYILALNNDIERLEQVYKRINKNPLGACALTGTSWNIDPKKTAKLLGFTGIEKNPFMTISFRGELEAELLFIIALISMKLSRLSEELILLSYVGIVELPEEYCTGSSIMPNKKNPDALELIRGKSGRMYGNLLNVLTILKGLMSGHNADTQETKKPVMDSVEQISSCLDIISEILGGLKWNSKKAKQELERGNAQATQMADELVRKGMSFRDAHKKIGEYLKMNKN